MNDTRPPSGTHASGQRAQATRVRALQGPLDRRIYHPLADRLARRLARTRVTPNMVSVAGGLAVAMAGVAYIQPWGMAAVAAGLLIHMSWHVLDGADGALARLTGRAGPAGEVIDGICDYGGHFVLYLILALAWGERSGWWIIPLAIAAGASRMVQANFYEVRRRQFMAWIHGVPWLRSADKAASLPFGVLVRTYLRFAEWLAPDDPRIDSLVADSGRREDVRSALDKMGPSALSGGFLLGANSRTLALGAAMAAGSPAWYFLYEVALLNPVLVIAIRRSRRLLARIGREDQSPARTLR